MDFLTVFVIVALCSLYYTATPGRCTKRFKRIINGEDLRDKNSGYSVTNYFVWISNKHICGSFDSFRNFFNFVSGANSDYFTVGYYECDIDPQKLMCGGSLLTPSIVQTACHCVAKLITDSNGVKRFVPNDAYTDMALVIRGSTSTDDMRIGYVSNLFVVHEKCSWQFRNALYDYGLIALKRAIAPDAHFASRPANFAPIYPRKSIMDMWNRVHAKETVCLFVGFGRISDSPEDTTKPTVMQHSWGVVQNFDRCSVWRNPKNYEFNYTSDATWSCLVTLPGSQKKTSVNRGDSGSPVTCDNEYYGLVSAFVEHTYHRVSYRFPDKFFPIETNITIIAPLKFSTYVNSAETRTHFRRKMAMLNTEKRHRRLYDPLLQKLPPEELSSDFTNSGTALHVITLLNVLVTLLLSIKLN